MQIVQTSSSSGVNAKGAGTARVVDDASAAINGSASANDMALSDLKKTDMGAAAIDLNGYQTALQATYKAYAKVGNISLFDLL